MPLMDMASSIRAATGPGRGASSQAMRAVEMPACGVSCKADGPGDFLRGGGNGGAGLGDDGRDTASGASG
jgi:hypothetical protein